MQVSEKTLGAGEFGNILIDIERNLSIKKCKFYSTLGFIFHGRFIG